MPASLRTLVVALIGMIGFGGAAAQAQSPSYLVLAPDRGFLGDEEMRVSRTAGCVGSGS